MRGTVAKRIRRDVYGDHSIRTRTYTAPFAKFFRKPDGGQVMQATGQILCTGLRKQYQDAKRAYHGRNTN